MCCTCLDKRTNHTPLFLSSPSSSSSLSFTHLMSRLPSLPLRLSFSSSRSASPTLFLPRLNPPTVALLYIYTVIDIELQCSCLSVLFIFPLFLFQCEAVLWSFAVDPGDSEWSRLRLPPPNLSLNLSAPVRHSPFRLLFWIVGVLFWILFLYFLMNKCPTFLCIKQNVEVLHF